MSQKGEGKGAEPDSPKEESQSAAFLDGEGDQWYGRNKLALSQAPISHDVEIIKRVLGDYKPSIRKILEVGCGDGSKVLELSSYFQAKGSGVDPSASAVHDGNELDNGLELSVGIASDLPYDSDSFDFVYFGFCLYLIDRSEVFRAVAEADRVLKSGGFIAILDFDPKQRHKRPYHHKPGLFSYKANYADYFTVGGHYCSVAKESFSHSGRSFVQDSDERISITVLYKEEDPY